MTIGLFHKYCFPFHTYNLLLSNLKFCYSYQAIVKNIAKKKFYPKQACIRILGTTVVIQRLCECERERDWKEGGRERGGSNHRTS